MFEDAEGAEPDVVQRPRSKVLLFQVVEQQFNLLCKVQRRTRLDDLVHKLVKMPVQ